MEDYGVIPREIISHISTYEPYGRTMRDICTSFREVQDEVDKDRMIYLKKKYRDVSHAISDKNWDALLFMMDHICDFPTLEKHHLETIAQLAMDNHKYRVLVKALKLGASVYIAPTTKGHELEILSRYYNGPMLPNLVRVIAKRGRYDLLSILLDRDIDPDTIETIAIASAQVPILHILKKSLKLLPEKYIQNVLRKSLMSIPNICNSTDVTEEEKERCHEHIHASIVIARYLDIDQVAVIAASYNVLPVVYWALRHGSRAYHSMLRASLPSHRSELRKLISETQV